MKLHRPLIRTKSVPERGSTPTEHVPPWKFWRRLSSKRHNSSNKKYGDRVEISDGLLAGHSDGRSRRECIVKEPSRNSHGEEEDDLLEDLPDVLDTNALRRSQSVKPPPKPPRLFLMRSSSINHRNTQALTSSRNSFVMSPNKRNSKDEEFIKFPINIENGKFLTETTQKRSLYCIKDEGAESVNKVEPDVTSKTKSEGKSIKYSANGNPMRIKMDTSGQTHRQREAITKQSAVLNCLSELLCQRLKPTELIEEMYNKHVITSGDLQAFRGHPDHRLVCESLITTVSRGDDQQFAAFCQVLRNTDSYQDVSEMLDAMTKISFMISEINAMDDEENNILAEEKTMKFDVGFYDEAAHLLKPIIELDRIKTLNGKRGIGLRPPDTRFSQISTSSATEGSLHNTCGQDEKSSLLPMMTVSILGHNLKGDRTKVLADVLRTYNCILELCLGKTQLTSSDIGILSIPLQKNNSLTVLDVRLNPIGNEGACMLGNALEHNNTLRQLNLSSTGMDGDGCKRICDALKFNSALEDLDLSFVEIGDDGCVHIGEMLQQNESLKKLRLRSSSITWAGCEFLFNALNINTSLTDIDMSRNFIGNEGTDIVARHLAKKSCLRELNLENCGLTANGCIQLSQALSTNNCLLSKLDLSNNFIGDTGARKLSEAIEENTSLRCLGLNMCEITNDGFERILDALECNKTLHALKLCYNRLGRDTSSQTASSEDLRYRVRIVTSSRPKLKLLLWGNTFEES